MSANGVFLYQDLDIARGMGKTIVPVLIENRMQRDEKDALNFIERIQHIDATKKTIIQIANEIAELFK